MRTKVQFIAPLFEDINIYYVRDQFGRTWHTKAKDEAEAKKDICFKGDGVSTFKLYTTKKNGERIPQYDFKNMILDMLEQMGLQDTYEYEIVVGWDDREVLQFMKMSSMLPCDLLIEINKFDNLKG